MDNLKRVWSLLSVQERRRSYVLFVLLLVGMLFELLGVGAVVPLLIIVAEPDLAGRYPMLAPYLERLGNPSQEHLMLMGVAALGVVFIVRSVFLAFLAWIQTKYTFEVRIRLSRQLFERYLAQPYAYHLDTNSSSMIRNITTESFLFGQNALAPIIQVLTDGLVLFGICILLLWYDPVGSISVVLLFGFAAWLMQKLSAGRSRRWGETRQRHDGLRIQHLQQGLSGVKDVKLLGREAQFLETYDFHQTKSAVAGRKQNLLNRLPRIWLEPFALLGMGALVVTLVLQGKTSVEILPALALFAAAAFRVLPSANRMIGALQSIRFSLPVVELIDREMNLPLPVVNVESDEDNLKPIVFEESIRIQNLNFGYKTSSGRVLNDINLVIKKGSCIGVVGTSGSGKSTLVDLIIGLLKPTEGEILVDGLDIHSSLRSWQNQIGYVSQTIYLTDDSLRRNVAFGVEEDLIDDEAVAHALEAAQLSHYVASLPEGANTKVGEMGTSLSGGQRQRIGIARALYQNPEVLIFDEATSALDNETEREFMKAVESLRADRTIVIIAHRTSTIAKCDEIVKVSNGKVEVGTPLDFADEIEISPEVLVPLKAKR